MGKPIIALAGGIGAAKLLEGLYDVMNPDDLHIIVNTGDDYWFHGLLISPDVDIIIYTLAGQIHPKQRWGLRNDTFRVLNALSRFYGPQWFHVGDKDLTTAMFRTDLLHQKKNLTQITQEIALKYGIKAHLYPMCNEFMPTFLDTDIGVLEFEEYFVKHQCKPHINKIIHKNYETSKLNPDFNPLFEDASKIILCPSNPFVSINPILSIPGFRNLFTKYRQKVYGISPIINGQAIKGPLALILNDLGYAVNSHTIAQFYKAILGVFIIDTLDKIEQKSIENEGITVNSTSILMKTKKQKQHLAQFVLSL